MWKACIVAAMLVILVRPVYAQAGLAAFGKAIQDMGQIIGQGMIEEQARKDEYERQRRLMEYQYELEQQRVQVEQQRIQRMREAELRQAEGERRQREAAEAERKKTDEEAVRRAVNTGTGFFVAPGGYLVTNYHVIQDKTDYAIRDLKGRFYKATVIARDTSRDLALLKVSGTFSPLRVVSSDAVSKGQRVLAVGYPQISIQGNESKVTDGIISSFSGIRNDDDWFQISVPIQGGNSGGPLVTENGTVVGVVVASVNVAKFFKLTGSMPQNINYAIKSKVLLEFLKSERIQTLASSKSKTSIDAVDASTVLVIAKNGHIDVSYAVSPEQLAQDQRDRAKAAAQEAAQRKVEEAAAKKQAAIAATDEARRMKEERREAVERKEHARIIEKRDLEIQKSIPDWPELRKSEMFVRWLGKQSPENAQKYDSKKAADVVALILRYQSEKAEFAASLSRPPPIQVAAKTPREVTISSVQQPTLNSIGNIVEVNTQYGFAVVSTNQPIAKNSKLIVENSGDRIAGKAERNFDGRLSITLDNVPITSALLGSRVYLYSAQ